MKAILQKLILGKSLNQIEIHKALKIAMENEHPIQTTAFLALLEARGVEASDLVTIVDFLKPLSKHVVSPHTLLDIVGTGGDEAQTFNISTGSAILSAACGLFVAKHGNRAVSSNCGSADVLEKMGLELNHTPDTITQILDCCQIAFMYSPLFNPAMSALKDLRKKLGIRTVFNLIGPLLNPANPHFMLVGVYSEQFLDVYAQALQQLGKRALVFCSQGVDELTTASIAQARLVTEGSISEKVINPQELGFTKCSIKDLMGKDAIYNAQRLKETLKGEKGPWADTLIFNTACALYLCQKVPSIKEGITLARHKHLEGAGYQKYQAWVEAASQRGQNGK